jgi:hypothetical protein
MALQQTKELHKKLEELRPNAVFTSGVERNVFKDSLKSSAGNTLISSLNSTLPG